MKKICLLLAVCLLFGGCTQKPFPLESTAAESCVETTEPVEATPATESITVDHSYRGQDWASGYVIAEDWGFFCPHMDTDVYWPLVFRWDDLGFFLLSREPIDPDSVTITVGTELPYEVNVYEEDGYFENDSPGMGLLSSNFTMEIYASYQNWDWKRHKEENDRSMATTEDLLARAAYDAEYDAVREEYQKALLTGKGVPKFHIYYVQISIDYSAVRETEVIRHMDVSWPGVAFHHEFGELRIHPGYPLVGEDFPNSIENIGDAQGCMFSNGETFPYLGSQEDGILGGFIARKEIALLKGYALDGSGEVTDVRLVYETDEGAVDMHWDENSKVWLDAGTTVMVWAKAGGPETFWSVANEHIYYCIEYECDGVRDVFFFNNHHTTSGNPFELWALYFDETNLRSYYDDYWWAD